MFSCKQSDFSVSVTVYKLTAISKITDCLHSLFTNIKPLTVGHASVLLNLGTSGPEVPTPKESDMMSLTFALRHHVGKFNPTHQKAAEHCRLLPQIHQYVFSSILSEFHTF